jgi:hypothetical protein
MKITLFTSNQSRHNYFINKLSEISTELFVVQENDTRFPGLVSGHYPASEIYEEYFKNVLAAESKVFGDNFIASKNLNLISLLEGDINKCSLKFLSSFLKSDIYIVSGSSYIKGELADFLIEKKALSIHMGLAPYYRGTDCNFWALHDGRPDCVGATIYMISKGLDTGQILYHAISEIKDSPYVYTMSCVKSAFDSIVERIKNNSIYKNTILEQDRKKEIRYSKKTDFDEKAIKEFYKKKIDLNQKEVDTTMYKNPFVLKK